MNRKYQKTDFNTEFCARTRAAREAKGLTQIEMAQVLGIMADTYSKYERRTPLPHRFIPIFCLVCGVPLDDLFAMRHPPKVVQAEAKRTVR